MHMMIGRLFAFYQKMGEMTMDNNKKNCNQSTESQELFIAQLTYIGAAISTLGDGIQTIAAALALDALKNEKNQSSESSTDQSQKTESMQEQIDYIIAELKQMKEFLK